MSSTTGVKGLINLCLLIVSLTIILYTQLLVTNQRGSTERREEEIRYIFNAVLTVGILIWPILWDATIGYDKLIQNTRLIPGFLWVPVLTMLELQYVPQFSATTGEKGRASALFQYSDLKSDSSAIISAAFAMGSLLFSRGGIKTQAATTIIMYALVLCLAFVIPTLQVPPETKQAVLWRSVQHLILNYAIGFIISGISTDLFTKLFTQETPNTNTTTNTPKNTPTTNTPPPNTPFLNDDACKDTYHYNQNKLLMKNLNSSEFKNDDFLTLIDLPLLSKNVALMRPYKNIWRQV